jgi:hypothetical protein
MRLALSGSGTSMIMPVNFGKDVVVTRTMVITYHVGAVINHACLIGTQQKKWVMSGDVFANYMVFKVNRLWG